MQMTIDFSIGIIFSYLLGSIPTAYIFAKALKGIDIRNYGSGNVGATNAFRVLGKIPGSIVLIIDLTKGLLAVVLFGNLFAETLFIRAIFGLSSVCGHNWTIFLKGKGGKGVATTIGVIAGLAISAKELLPIFALTVVTWFLVFLVTRIVAIASMISAIFFPFFMIFFKQSISLILLSFILTVFIIIRHKSNIIKILHKEK
ncbi:MAG: glycerol-3-phosphate 1-O-acyltransferase PlsY [Candidatus Omnitrophota bacterium]